MKLTGVTNARIVLEDRIVFGSLLVDRDGSIVELDEDAVIRQGLLDLEGDFLLPGLVDVHTDNLERQVLPRTQARWPSRSAFMAHDGHCVAAGITTVADALTVGGIRYESQRIQTMKDALVDLADLRGLGLFRADHFLHVRCELPAPNFRELFEESMASGPVQMVSLMDHTPGGGQYTNLAKFRSARKAEGLDEQAIDFMIREAQALRDQHAADNRRYVLDRVGHLPVSLASHDDVDADEIRRNAEDGIMISEFPVSMAAARTAVELGMQTVAGAPNVVRGGSHSGNVAVSDLVAEGCVTALASDYYPSALLESAFWLARHNLCSLPASVAMVTAAPSRMLGLTDRGVIAPGCRADLVRVKEIVGHPLVRGVWRSGERVA